MNYPDDDFKAFKAWAGDNGVPYEPPTPLSALLRLIAAMMDAGKSYSTIEHRVFGVSAYNVRHGELALAKNDQIKAALTAALLNSEHTARIRKDALLRRDCAQRSAPSAAKCKRRRRCATSRSSRSHAPRAQSRARFRSYAAETYATTASSGTSAFVVAERLRRGCSPCRTRTPSFVRSTRCATTLPRFS